MNAVPTRDGTDALHVDCPGLVIAGMDGTATCRECFFTGITVDMGNAAELAASGWARWNPRPRRLGS